MKTDMAPDLAARSKLYTVQEAAAKLSLPVSWLYERTRKNAIPCRRFGKYVRFTDEDLAAIITSGAADGQGGSDARPERQCRSEG